MIYGVVVVAVVELLTCTFLHARQWGTTALFENQPSV